MFLVLLIFVLEPPLSYLHLYHVLCLTITNLIIGGSTYEQYNPIYLLIIVELTGWRLKQWAYESMKDEDLLPLAIKTGNRVKTDKNLVVDVV